jgi:hypothetical protein
MTKRSFRTLHLIMIAIMKLFNPEKVVIFKKEV